MPQACEVGQEGLKEAGLSAAQESLAQALPSFVLDTVLPGACWGVVGNVWRGGQYLLGRGPAPPGHGEAQELRLPPGRMWRSAGCWRTWTEPSWCWTRLWMEIRFNVSQSQANKIGI